MKLILTYSNHKFYLKLKKKLELQFARGLKSLHRIAFFSFLFHTVCLAYIIFPKQKALIACLPSA